MAEGIPPKGSERGEVSEGMLWDYWNAAGVLLERKKYVRLLVSVCLSYFLLSWAKCNSVHCFREHIILLLSYRVFPYVSGGLISLKTMQYGYSHNFGLL